MEQKLIPNHLIFYDGECGFCNRSVQFILTHKKEDFHFVALQSTYAIELLKKKGIKVNIDTIYYLKDGKLFDRSSSILQITKRLKGLYPLLFIFYIVPKFLRDFIYQIIARNRHRLRGNYCVIPTKKDLPFFIKEE